jgi:mono/diheme cytochrome c family protein
MKPAALALAAAALASAAVATAAFAMVAPPRGAAPQDQDAVARGRYLVHEVAMCVQCHSPRRGAALVESRLLAGAPVPVEAPLGIDDWALHAPRIAGFPGYTLDQGVRLLTEGVARDGATPRAPMPPFRMTREDAEAVVRYLQSLP